MRTCTITIGVLFTTKNKVIIIFNANQSVSSRTLANQSVSSRTLLTEFKKLILHILFL